MKEFTAEQERALEYAKALIGKVAVEIRDDEEKEGELFFYLDNLKAWLEKVLG